MDKGKLEALATAADAVAGEHETQQDAIRKEREQGAALLDAVVTRIKRALPALSSQVNCRYRSWWIDNCYTADEVESFTWRGLRAWGDGPEEDHPRALRGNYEGGGIWLDTKGTWHMVTYGGIWSRWQGEGDEWEARDRLLTTYEAVECAGVDSLLTAISEALDSHVGKREKSTARAARAAERLAAMRKLF